MILNMYLINFGLNSTYEYKEGHLVATKYKKI
jgi:hypothetical protein